MATPSIQVLITQAQQVLNLQSSNEIRATLAAVLANANVGTPLNPNLTTQQLWDEFDEIVRQSTDDILSIIVDQMMRFVYAPPAPGGAGADKQVIFNDMGVLAGDAGLVYNKTTDALTVAGLVTAGSATITGDLTVRTNKLFVNATNVGIGTVTPNAAYILDLTTANDARARQWVADTSFLGSGNLVNGYQLRTLGASTDGVKISNYANSVEYLRIDNTYNVTVQFGNVVMATSGKGIDFSATTSNGTSELLNDYEEGIFTPTVIGTSFAGGATYARQLGRYTKVGNLVTVQIYLAWALGTGSGNLAFGGLPFTIANNANEYASVAIGQFDNIALTASNVPSIIGSPNTTIFNLNQFPVGGGSSAGVAYDAAGAIIMTSTYIV